jgi:hypothetical protein
MKKLAIFIFVLLVIARTPLSTPSKLLPASWVNNWKYGKQSIQLVYRLYQIQHHSEPSTFQSAEQQTDQSKHKAEHSDCG